MHPLRYKVSKFSRSHVLNCQCQLIDDYISWEDICLNHLLKDHLLATCKEKTQKTPGFAMKIMKIAMIGL